MTNTKFIIDGLPIKSHLKKKCKNTISLIQLYHSEYEPDKKGFVNIPAAAIRIITNPKQYLKVMNILLAKKLIISDNHFMSGFKCYGYKLNNAYIYDPSSLSPVLLKKIDEFRDKQVINKRIFEANTIQYSVLKQIKEKYYPNTEKRLHSNGGNEYYNSNNKKNNTLINKREIFIDEYLKEHSENSKEITKQDLIEHDILTEAWIKQIKGIHYEGKYSKLYGYQTELELKEGCTDIVLINKMNRNLHKKHFKVKNSDKIYSFFTNITASQRKDLLYKGESIGGLDISSFYPVLFCEYIDEDYEDEKLYCKLVQSGEFYEYFRQLCYNEPDKSIRVKIQTLKTAKEHFLHSVFNSKYRIGEGTKYEKVFEKYFPSVWATMLKCKREHKTICEYLFRLDSQIMIKEIGLPLAEANIPVFIVHDCIYTTTSKLEIVRKSIKYVFSTHGLKVNLKDK